MALLRLFSPASHTVQITEVGFICPFGKLASSVLLSNLVVVDTISLGATAVVVVLCLVLEHLQFQPIPDTEYLPFDHW